MFPRKSLISFYRYFPWCFSNFRHRFLHRTSSNSSPIEEFFDSKENWSAEEVRTGRPWRLEELRLKSGADLQKLWYVLLKERNMLLTMEEAAKRETEMFPNAERIDKVEESMENLEKVVRERNAAYFSLEHGVTGEPPQRVVTSMVGFHEKKQTQEHVEPAYMHPQGKGYEAPYLDDAQYEFQKLWKEREWWKEFYKRDDERRITKRHKYLHKW